MGRRGDELATLAILILLLKGAGSWLSWDKPWAYTGPKRGPFGKGEVERVRTRVALAGLDELFQKAIHDEIGLAHGWGKLARVLVAQSRVECGAQLGSMYHFNFGNLTWRDGAGEWFRNPPGGSMRYRVFNTPEQGARAMVHWVAKHAPAALAYAELGDTAMYARIIRDHGYFTSDLGEYQQALSDRFREGTPN